MVPDSLSPLVLAYVGDAVFELHVRTALVAQGASNVNELHREATKVVRASAQARVLRELVEGLSEEEQDIVRRGRNAKGGPGPKGADIQEYRYSTGFEALLGYLYLTGRTTRLAELLDLAFPTKQA